MEGILHVAAAFHAERIDDVDGARPEHLVVLVRQRLARRDDDGVAGMHPYGIKVFHVAHDDAVPVPVADYLVFNLLPPGDALFNEYLPHAGEGQAVQGDLFELTLVFRDAAAGSAERVGRAHDDGKADAPGEVPGVDPGGYHL